MKNIEICQPSQIEKSDEFNISDSELSKSNISQKDERNMISMYNIKQDNKKVNYNNFKCIINLNQPRIGARHKSVEE